MERPEGKLVGLAGLAGSGKSTAAQVLIDKGYIRVKNASMLKGMLRLLYGVSDLKPVEIERRIEGDLKETPDPILMGKTPRHAMVTLGTEWGRDLIHPDLWATLWKAQASALMERGMNVVVDDVRFPNEEQALRDLGGSLYLIQRETQGISSGHISERLELNFDAVIPNTGTIEDLKGALLTAI